jgi:CheY-like chemotaxis protein
MCVDLNVLSEQDKARPVILIVDDETLIRLAAVHIAEDEGFEVVEAANADEAIEILEGRDDIRVIFTDIICPGPWTG